MIKYTSVKDYKMETHLGEQFKMFDDREYSEHQGRVMPREEDEKGEYSPL